MRWKGSVLAPRGARPRLRHWLSRPIAREAPGPPLRPHPLRALLGRELQREFDSIVGDDLAERDGDPAMQASEVTSSPARPRWSRRRRGRVAERPAKFYGKNVSLEGTVSDVLPAGALVIDDEVLALAADFAGPRLREGQRVRLVGPVRCLPRSEPLRRERPGRRRRRRRAARPARQPPGDRRALDRGPGRPAVGLGVSPSASVEISSIVLATITARPSNGSKTPAPKLMAVSLASGVHASLARSPCSASSRW